MEQSNVDKEIIMKLFVSKETLAERLTSIVDLSRGVIQIIQDSGEILIESSGDLKNSEKIFLYLLGAYFAYKSGLRKGPQMPLGEISDRVGVPSTTIPAPMNGLIREKIVLKTEKGLYQINFENYKNLRETMQKIRGKMIHSGGSK